MSKGMLGNVSLPLLAGPMRDLFEKLASSEGLFWFDALKKLLRKENPWEQVQSNFLAWRTIEVGTHKSLEELVGAVEAQGHQITNEARACLTNIKVADQLTKLELVWVTPADLFIEPKKFWCLEAGVIASAYCYEDIRNRAKEFGLEECPNELALQFLMLSEQNLESYLDPELARDYLRQFHECVRIAGEVSGPERGGYSTYLFNVKCDKNTKHRTLDVDSNYSMPAYAREHVFIFCRRSTMP